MSDIAIRAMNLGKQYRIGGKQAGYRTFREAVLTSLTAPVRWMRGERKSFDTFWALDDVSFEINQGEAVGIIGRNGAGKSTLLKVLSRITKPTKGRVDLYGRIASLLEVGTGFHGELSGRDNIYLNGAILGMTRREINRKFDEIVDFAEVDKFLDTQVKHYSSGMYVRLAFAVAAYLEPEILVVDEVLAVGDAEFQKKSLGKMSDVTKEGRTVLFVSHNMNAVEQLCQSCMLLDKGKVLKFESNVQEVIKEYLFTNSRDSGSEWHRTSEKYDNDYFKPTSLRIVNKNGVSLDSASHSSDVYVQIEAEVGIIDPALTIGYALYNEENLLLYWSYQTDVAEANWPVLKKGRWQLKAKLPSRFLNEGLYRIEIVGGLHFRQWFFEPGHDVPSVLFTVRGGISDSPYWMVKRPGVLAPVIEWTANEIR
jgi:lipopolysaccharide transport system ATP-binding protein